jgi:hypothetical protein
MTKRLVLSIYIYMVYSHIWVNTIATFSTSSYGWLPLWLQTKTLKENAANGLELEVSVAVTCSQRFCGIQKRKLWTDCCSLLLKSSRLCVAIYALYLAAKHAVKLSVHVSSCPTCNWHWFWCVEIQCTRSYNPLGFNCWDKEGTVFGISWRPRDLQWAKLWEEFVNLI